MYGLLFKLKVRLKGYSGCEGPEGPGLLKSVILTSLQLLRAHPFAQRPLEKTKGPGLAIERTELWF